MASIVLPQDVVLLDVTPAGVSVVSQVFFQLGSSELDVDGAAAVKQVVDALASQPAATVVLSGFHDSQGGAAVNAEVAKQRAMAVRAALQTQGIPAERLRLVKPQESLGGADDRQARRVDIGLLP